MMTKFRAVRWLALIFLACCTAALAGEDAAANEREAVAALRNFARAQELYRRVDWDSDGMLEYAQTLTGGRRPPAAVPDSARLPAAGGEREKLDALILALGSGVYSERERAASELTQLGFRAYSALRSAARTSRDPEVIQRSTILLDQITAGTGLEKKEELRHGLYSSGRNGAAEGDAGLIDKAFARAECLAGADPALSVPKSGYLFRVLTRQGPSGPGGARSWVIAHGSVDGRAVSSMALGYGLLAFPSAYGTSGRKVYIISNQGLVYGRDLGDAQKTKAFVDACDTYEPTPGQWTQQE